MMRRRSPAGELRPRKGWPLPTDCESCGGAAELVRSSGVFQAVRHSADDALLPGGGAAGSWSAAAQQVGQSGSCQSSETFSEQRAVVRGREARMGEHFPQDGATHPVLPDQSAQLAASAGCGTCCPAGSASHPPRQGQTARDRCHQRCLGPQEWEGCSGTR